MKRRYISRCEEDTRKIGEEISKTCSDGDFVALFGDMGSGKTVFMHGFVRNLIPEAMVSSPTYSILNVYENKSNTVNHFDMYRITSDDDLASTGFEEVIQSGITVCEWPENILQSLPDRYLRIDFVKVSENERELLVERIEK